MVPLDKLEQINQRFQYLEAAMSEGNGDIAALGKEYSDLRPVVEQIAAYQQLLADLEEAQHMLADPEMKELAEEELPILKAQLPEVEKALQITLLPKDAADARPAMIEIRPGTGGEEAALFAGDLLRMYQRYSEARGWKFQIVEESQTELGGIKEVSVSVQGEGVFARLKYESGVHRVQRVPSTESGGRIHTSAATVAVLPEAQDVDIKIDQNDIRIDTMPARAQAASTSTRPILPCGSPTCQPALLSQALRNRSTGIARSLCRCLKRGSMILSGKKSMTSARRIESLRSAAGIAASAFGPIISPKAV
jgi:peptide chain release factor 1